MYLQYTAMPLLLVKKSVELAESCCPPSQNLVVWDFSEPQLWVCSLEWQQPQSNAQCPELKGDHIEEFACVWLRQWKPLFKMLLENTLLIPQSSNVTPDILYSVTTKDLILTVFLTAPFWLGSFVSPIDITLRSFLQNPLSRSDLWWLDRDIFEACIEETVPRNLVVQYITRPQSKNALGGDQSHQGGWSSVELNYGKHGESGNVRTLNISCLPSETFFCFVTRSFLLQLENVDPMFRFAARSQSASCSWRCKLSVHVLHLTKLGTSNSRGFGFSILRRIFQSNSRWVKTESYLEVVTLLSRSSKASCLLRADQVRLRPAPKGTGVPQSWPFCL